MDSQEMAKLILDCVGDASATFDEVRAACGEEANGSESVDIDGMQCGGVSPLFRDALAIAQLNGIARCVDPLFLRDHFIQGGKILIRSTAIVNQHDHRLAARGSERGRAFFDQVVLDPRTPKTTLAEILKLPVHAVELFGESLGFLWRTEKWIDTNLSRGVK
jgi:hypothetical protein